MGGAVLITGAAGQLAETLAAVLRPTREVHAVRRQELDITDERAVLAMVQALRPVAIINGASFNDVDGAETRPREALAVNAMGVRALARAATDVGARLVHYSTDFVFDGHATAPYPETASPNPQSVYASSKLLGEWFALAAPGAYVLRVESLFGAGGRHVRRSSLDKMVAAIDAGDEVTVFTDRTVSPSYVVDVASATCAVLDGRPEPGLYHCVNDGAATWLEIARDIARLLGREPRLRLTTMAGARLVAARPAYCALSPAKLAAAGVVMPTWQDALARRIRAR